MSWLPGIVVIAWIGEVGPAWIERSSVVSNSNSQPNRVRLPLVIKRRNNELLSVDTRCIDVLWHRY